jgi:hypothetical protein
MNRFSIRDLLWLTVVVALAVGWGVQYRRATAREAAWQTSFQSALERLAFRVQGEEAETFDSPSGLWRIHCTMGVELPNE